MDWWISGWTVQNLCRTKWVWMWELVKEECVRTSVGPEVAYWCGSEFTRESIRMGGYDFPGQIAGSDGSEGNGSMGTGFIVLENPLVTGSIRVDRTEGDADSMRVEMTDLLEVLIETNVKENLVVMVNNHSILREISRWVGEGVRTFLVLSVNPDGPTPTTPARPHTHVDTVAHSEHHPSRPTVPAQSIARTVLVPECVP